MRFKAVSVQQPWAELVMQGRKTLLLRTFTTHHRGPLAIHAPRRVRRDLCQPLGVSPAGLPTGAVVGVVRLAGVRPLDRESFEAHAPRHFGEHRYREPMYAWEVERPRRLLAPWPTPGRHRVFEVDVPEALLIETKEEAREDLSEQAVFELRVVPPREGGERGDGYGLALYQRKVEGKGQHALLYAPRVGRDLVKVAELQGDRLRTVAEAVIAALREAGYRATDLSRARREPFLLPEETGVRLGLLFLAAAPVSKVPRLEAIVQGLLTMPAEEAYYWYSKCAQGPHASRAQRALRLLLSEE